VSDLVELMPAVQRRLLRGDLPPRGADYRLVAKALDRIGGCTPGEWPLVAARLLDLEDEVERLRAACSPRGRRLVGTCDCAAYDRDHNDHTAEQHTRCGGSLAGGSLPCGGCDDCVSQQVASHHRPAPERTSTP
jgi:hypothetical protein